MTNEEYSFLCLFNLYFPELQLATPFPCEVCILMSVFVGVGSICMGAARGIYSLLIGRVLYGLGVALAMHGGPAYIAETAPSQVRGILISGKEAANMAGTLLGYLVSYIFADVKGGWRWIYYLGAPQALVLGIGMVSSCSTVKKETKLDNLGRDKILEEEPLHVLACRLFCQNLQDGWYSTAQIVKQPFPLS